MLHIHGTGQRRDPVRPHLYKSVSLGCLPKPRPMGLDNKGPSDWARDLPCHCLSEPSKLETTKNLTASSFQSRHRRAGQVDGYLLKTSRTIIKKLRNQPLSQLRQPHQIRGNNKYQSLSTSTISSTHENQDSGGGKHRQTNTSFRP